MPTKQSAHLATVFGGTGYLGRHIVAQLVASGWHVRIAVRHPRKKTRRDDSMEQIRADVTDAESVARAVQGAVAVVNSVSLYVESKTSKFSAVHVQGAGEVAVQAAQAGAALVHISGIGADPESPSRYVAARAAGERIVRDFAPDAVILRPSVLFGSNDAFLGTLIKLVRLSPVLPLFGWGDKRLQPVHVEDVAAAAARALGDLGPARKIFELGGPHIYTYRELLESIAHHLGRRRIFLPVPFFVWHALAAVSALLPQPPLTRDQIILVSDDNVVDRSYGTFRQLGIDARRLEDELELRTGH